MERYKFNIHDNSHHPYFVYVPILCIRVIFHSRLYFFVLKSWIHCVHRDIEFQFEIENTFSNDAKKKFWKAFLISTFFFYFTRNIQQHSTVRLWLEQMNSEMFFFLLASILIGKVSNIFCFFMGKRDLSTAHTR